jgi:hypothetical protein
MPDSFTLPLRPIKPKADQRDTLALRIAQINAQYGSFRNVTEASLQAEIDAEQHPDESVDQKPPEKESLDTRQEELFKSRSEILEAAMCVYSSSSFPVFDANWI